MRRQSPLFPVNRPTLPIERSLELGQRGALVVAVEVVGLDGQRRVVAPLVRVADHRLELRQLVERLRLRRIRHPVELPNGLLIGLDEISDKLEHALLRFRREVSLDVDAADRLAEKLVHEKRRAPPVGPLLFDAR